MWSCLIGIDIGVLDDDLFARTRGGFALAAQQSRAVRSAIEANVDVAIAGHFHGSHAINRPDLVHQFGGDLPGRLPQLFGQLEGCRHGYFAELALPRLLDTHCQIDAVPDLNMRVESARNLFFDGVEHGNPEYNNPPG